MSFKKSQSDVDEIKTYLAASAPTDTTAAVFH